MTRANKIVLTGALSVLELPVGCKSSPPPSSTVATEASPAVSQSPKVPVIYLNQGWSQADREMYYWTSQGSTGFSYDIYLNMEVVATASCGVNHAKVQASRASCRQTGGLKSDMADDPNQQLPLDNTGGPGAANVQPVNIEEEMRRSYLDYSMSVIIGRALPDVRDG